MLQAVAFAVPRNWRPAEMLNEDLKVAEIQDPDESGRVLDFHALRHTFITNLAQAGVHPKTAQVLARHSTISLTMARYTHTFVATKHERSKRFLISEHPVQ